MSAKTENDLPQVALIILRELPERRSQSSAERLIIDRVQRFDVCFFFADPDEHGARTFIEIRTGVAAIVVAQYIARPVVSRPD